MTRLTTPQRFLEFLWHIGGRACRLRQQHRGHRLAECGRGPHQAGAAGAETVVASHQGAGSQSLERQPVAG